MQSNEFMNAEEVARYLHLGKNTVYQLAKTGKLSSYHVGRKLRFSLEDVEAYVASTHCYGADRGRSVAIPRKVDDEVSDQDAQTITEAASFGELKGDSFVIAGCDLVADMLAGWLNSAGVLSSRMNQGSYTALVNLYAGEADAAVVRLYDQKTNSYNIPYVRNLAPGLSASVYRLIGREVGLVVRTGNPKHVTSWGGLLREGVRLANREKGSGARVLLDEKLRAMDARVESVEGYGSCSPVASVALKRVASGVADVAIGNARDVYRQPGLEFVPLQTEWVDLVVAKRNGNRSERQRLAALLKEGSRLNTGNLEPCDLSKFGCVIYES